MTDSAQGNAATQKPAFRWGRTPTLADPEFAEALESLRRKVTSSPEAARAFLREVGIVDENGRLTKTYGG